MICRRFTQRKRHLYAALKLCPEAAVKVLFRKIRQSVATAPPGITKKTPHARDTRRQHPQQISDPLCIGRGRHVGRRIDQPANSAGAHARRNQNRQSRAGPDPRRTRGLVGTRHRHVDVASARCLEQRPGKLCRRSRKTKEISRQSIDIASRRHRYQRLGRVEQHNRQNARRQGQPLRPRTFPDP